MKDDDLLATALTTDDPEALEDLVREVPPGDEEPFVEYAYDLSGSDHPRLHCVHENHAHLKGFVMNKGGKRFLVGWVCGEKLYGENFNQYHADFDAAVTRQDSLKRAREIKRATEPFAAWLTQVAESDVFKRFESVREQIFEHFEWIHENLFFISEADVRARRANVPYQLFDEDNDPEVDWKKAVADFNILATLVIAKDDWAEKNIVGMKRRMECLFQRFEEVLKRLKELETLFQPEVLAIVCDYANKYDNPKKRTYVPGLLTITCKRGKNPTTVCMPKNYKVPSMQRIEAFRATLVGLPLSKSTAA
jgi:hypothetical protein